MVTRLSAAYLLAGRLEEARHRAAQTVEPAAGHYREALALAEELGMRPHRAVCRHTLYRAMEMQFWLPQAEAALARVEGR
jgi:hypothetical protein